MFLVHFGVFIVFNSGDFGTASDCIIADGIPASTPQENGRIDQAYQISVI